MTEADEARYHGDSPIGGDLLAWILYGIKYVGGGDNEHPRFQGVRL